MGQSRAVCWPFCHPLWVAPHNLRPCGAVWERAPRAAVPRWQGQGWLTEGVELRDAGALALGLRGGLAYLTLEGGEEVLAKFFGHVRLQVGLHEEAKALVVDGLGKGQRRRMEVPWALQGDAELPVAGCGGVLCRGPPHWANQLQSPSQNCRLPKSQQW